MTFEGAVLIYAAFVTVVGGGVAAFGLWYSDRALKRHGLK